MAPRIKIADLFATIGADTKDLEKGLGTAKGSLTGFAGDFLKQTMGIVSATALITGAVKTVADSVSDWSAYNIEMDKGATATGMMADEYSRLIQAADDARVSQEQMTTALEMATKNGYPMTIKGLGQIADQLKSIQDPSERAKKAMEIFGRGWSDIMPLLDEGSAGINALTDAIDDNMIATEESIRKSQEYATQVDDLQDAWQGFKNELGAAVMPVLTDALSLIVEQSKEVKTFSSNTQLLADAHKSGEITLGQYTSAMLQNIWTVEDGTEAIEKLGLSQDATNTKIGDGAGANSEYASTMNESEEAIEAALVAQEALAKQASETAAKFREQKAAITSLDENFGDIIGLAKQIDQALEAIDEQEDIMANNPIGSEKYQEAKEKVDELKQSMMDLANQVVLDMFQATIAIDGITQAEANAYFKMAEDMGIISSTAANYAKEIYGQAIAEINGIQLDPKTGQVDVNRVDYEWQPWQPNKKIGKVEVERNSKEWDGWKAGAKRVSMRPDTTEVENYIKSDHYLKIRLQESGMSARAEGGPVYSGTPYKVGERGPELFIPTSSGYILSRADAERSLSAAVAGANSGSLEAGAIANAVAQAIGSVMAGRGGNVYNLTMPTSNSPADVGMAFELMRAMGA